MTRPDPNYAHQLAMEDLPYRSGVGIMLLNKNNQVFVARRIDMAVDAWQMPQGGIDSGEEPFQAALRELKEETGTDLVEIIAEGKQWLQYDLPPDLITKIWKGRFRGQRQKWFALRFLGNDCDINIHTDNPEFDAWKWVDPIDLPNLIVSFKKDLYAKVLEELLPVVGEGRF